MNDAFVKTEFWMSFKELMCLRLKLRIANHKKEESKVGKDIKLRLL